MTREYKIECIIVGTIMNNSVCNDYYNECRFIITDDMFADEFHKKIYRAVKKIWESGMKYISPLEVFQEIGGTPETAYNLCVLSSEFHFEYMKYVFNRNERHKINGKPNLTRIQFVDYIKQFVKNYGKTLHNRS